MRSAVISMVSAVCFFLTLLLAPGLALANPLLKNGVSLHGPMTWGRTNASGTWYAWPVYQGSQYDVPTSLLTKAKAAGFDYIRLTVDPGPFLAYKGTQLAALNQRLLDVVSQIRQAGLDVIVDFHPIWMIPSYTPPKIEFNVGGLFVSYVALVGNTAALLASQSDHVAIEVMNEPQLGYDTAPINRWQWMAGQLYQAVRKAAPTMTVILTGCESGGVDGLMVFDPKPFLADKNVRYSVHYYLPYVFTEQTLQDPSTLAYQFVHNLPYPATLSSLDAFWPSVQQGIYASTLTAAQKQQAVSDAQAQLTAYFNGGGTRAGIDADFLRVAQWASANYVPAGQMIMGEFGAVQVGPNFTGAQPGDRARWLSDVRQEAEAAGYSWGMWNLNDPTSNGMTLVSVTDPTSLDSVTLQALGK